MKPNRPAETRFDGVQPELYELAVTSMEKAGLSTDGQHLWRQLFDEAQCRAGSTLVKPYRWRMKVAELVDCKGEQFVDLLRLEILIDECMSTVIEWHDAYVDPSTGKRARWVAAQVLTWVRMFGIGDDCYLEWTFDPPIAQMMVPRPVDALRPGNEMTIESTPRSHASIFGL